MMIATTCTVQIWFEDGWIDCAEVSLRGDAATGWECASQLMYEQLYACRFLE